MAALVSSIIKPDIVISFGTAGGVTEKSKSEYGMGAQSNSKTKDKETEDTDAKSDDKQKESVSAVSDQKEDSDDQMVDTVKIGDVVLGEACLFLDRLRTRNKTVSYTVLWFI